MSVIKFSNLELVAPTSRLLDVGVAGLSIVQLFLNALADSTGPLSFGVIVIYAFDMASCSCSLIVCNGQLISI